MKNRKIKFYVLIAVLLLVATSSCNVIMKTIHPFNAQNDCPTNNPKYFFKKNGAKPTRNYVRNNRFTQRRHKY
jgi:hypothetical protein